ncbi:MAG: hypothetical protein RLZ12_274, partial [Bacillota bacterium]
MGITAFLFPGQGSQKVGMGLDLTKEDTLARQTFDEADQALGYKLSQLIFNGPAEKLMSTAYAQPAILTHSIALYRLFCSLTEARPAYMAGHSLGEYSALVAAGALNFQEAVKLVHDRGFYMEEAVPTKTGAMAAILGLPKEPIEKACQA